MKNLRLKREEIEKLAYQIFGHRSFLFFGDLYEIFYERNSLSLLEKFSQRFEKLCEQKSKLGNKNQIAPLLSELYSQVLIYLRNSKFLDENEYQEEFERCRAIWDKFFLR